VNRDLQPRTGFWRDAKTNRREDSIVGHCTARGAAGSTLVVGSLAPYASSKARVERASGLLRRASRTPRATPTMLAGE
jgi:hypothetical protein